MIQDLYDEVLVDKNSWSVVLYRYYFYTYVFNHFSIKLKVKDFPPENIFPFDSKRGVTGDVGHYTQIAWADTNKVGCGFIMYKKGSWFKKVTYILEIH